MICRFEFQTPLCEDFFGWDDFSPTAGLIGVLMDKIVYRDVAANLLAGSENGSARVPRIKNILASGLPVRVPLLYILSHKTFSPMVGAANRGS